MQWKWKYPSKYSRLHGFKCELQYYNLHYVNLKWMIMLLIKIGLKKFCSYPVVTFTNVTAQYYSVSKLTSFRQIIKSQNKNQC